MYGLPSLAHLLAFLDASKYPLFFLGSYIEGTAVMLTGGVLLKLGLVTFVPLYIALLLGDILSDMMWYWIGYFGARTLIMRWGYLIKATPDVVAKLERGFHKYHLRILVISKLTGGFGFSIPVLATAGMLRLSFIRYVVINSLGSLVWVGALVLIGYTFGNILQLIPQQFQLALFVVLLGAFLFGLRTINERLARVDW